MRNRAAPAQDTRTRLLDAAEQVLLESGIEGLSLRRITTAAGANIASVNYTFGSKDALLQELLNRLMMPVTTERIRRIDILTEAGEVALPDLLRAFAEPLLSVDERVAPLVMELMVKPWLVGQDDLIAVSMHAVAPGIERFMAALGPLLSTHSAESVRLRLDLFLVTSAIYIMERFRLTPEIDRHRLVDEIVAFSTAGFTAAV